MSASAVSRMCVVVMAVLTSPELKTHRPYKAPGRRPRNTLPDPPDHANAGLQKDLVPFRPRCPAVPNQTPAPRGKENAEAPAAPYFRIPERRQRSDVGDKTPAGRPGESAASPRGAFASPAARSVSSSTVLDRGGSDTRTGERHVRDSAGRGGGLDLVVLPEALQSVPEPHASAEQDRNDHDVHVVDEPCREEVADRRGTSADPYVQAVGSLAGSLQCLGRRSFDEVKGGAALHLDRRARVMGKNEHRCVEWRVGTPPALPLRVLVPSGVAELPGTHDLDADATIVQPHDGVVDATGAAGLAEPLAPPPGREHPFVQPFAGVAERCVEAQTFAGAETVERDGEELDAGE